MPFGKFGEKIPDKLFEGEPVLSDDEFKEIYYDLCDDFGFEKKIKFDGKTFSESEMEVFRT